MRLGTTRRPWQVGGSSVGSAAGRRRQAVLEVEGGESNAASERQRPAGQGIGRGDAGMEAR